MAISVRPILSIMSLSLMCFFLVSNQTSAQITYVEDFPDSISIWTKRWFYKNTNAENYYVARGNCDPNNRGNESNGLWISDDRGCGNFSSRSRVRINLINNFGNDAISFSIGVSSCLQLTVLNIYDRNGALVISETLPRSCFSFPNYSYALKNGISAFEFVNAIRIEGNTAIDNVTLIKQSSQATAVPTMTEWGMIIFMILAGLGSVYYLRRQKRA